MLLTLKEIDNPFMLLCDSFVPYLYKITKEFLQEEVLYKQRG